MYHLAECSVCYHVVCLLFIFSRAFWTVETTGMKWVWGWSWIMCTSVGKFWVATGSHLHQTKDETDSYVALLLMRPGAQAHSRHHSCTHLQHVGDSPSAMQLNFDPQPQSLRPALFPSPQITMFISVLVCAWKHVIQIYISSLCWSYTSWLVSRHHWIRNFDYFV